MNQDWPTMIAQLGFPIGVAIYLLVRMETTIKELTRVVALLAAKVGVQDNGSSIQK